jgi:hypothetical protein
MVATHHPDLEDLPLPETVGTFSKNCKNMNLRLTPKASKPTGRITMDRESELPFMAGVALKCRAILPTDSPFS